jgi:hypothetical protein
MCTPSGDQTGLNSRADWSVSRVVAWSQSPFSPQVTAIGTGQICRPDPNSAAGVGRPATIEVEQVVSSDAIDCLTIAISQPVVGVAVDDISECVGVARQPIRRVVTVAGEGLPTRRDTRQVAIGVIRVDDAAVSRIASLTTRGG